MMIKLPLLLLAIAATAPALAEAPVKRPLGDETVITFAGSGGIRDYQPGEPGVVFLQDRRLHWYRVQTSGDCLQSRTGSDTLIFKTDVLGTFDRFSRIGTSRYPGRICGVTSIRSSLPPPGQPGAPKSAAQGR